MVDTARPIAPVGGMTLYHAAYFAYDLTKRAPRDGEGFAGNDQLKTNAVQTFKTKGTAFRTL